MAKLMTDKVAKTSVPTAAQAERWFSQAPISDLCIRIGWVGPEGSGGTGRRAAWTFEHGIDDAELRLADTALLGLSFETAEQGKCLRLEPQLFMGLWPISFDASELYEIVIAQRTLARRLKANEPLTIEESDRALRLTRVGAEATRVLGNSEKAARWLRKKSVRFHGQSPMDLLRTEMGARIVEDVLTQIDHGMFG